MLKSDGLKENEFIGENPNFSHLILHFHDSIDVLADDLLEMIDLGNLEPWDFARVVDRKRNFSGECLTYFSYTIGAKNLNCIELQQVIENRGKIGLSRYYSRSSVYYYILPGSMMKHPLEMFYKKETHKNYK